MEDGDGVKNMACKTYDGRPLLYPRNLRVNRIRLPTDREGVGQEAILGNG